MLHFTKGQTETVILTLKEKATLSAPNYLFIFTSKVTNLEVKFVLLNNTDLSNYKDRFNKFSLVINTYFVNVLPGEYGYTIYEQTSSSNLDPSLATGILETGQMALNNSTDFEFTTYNATTNTYKVRDI
jgi:hypothetical protein